MQIRDLNLSQFERLSALLDESIDLEPPAREEWLTGVERDDPQMARILRRLFASRGVESDALLQSHDALKRQLAAIVHNEDESIGRRFGPYLVLSLLGRGGMGSVWLAERADGLFARKVALKLVHPALMGHAVTERFAREREILASLSHPNIARLLDAGIAEDGQPYLALQYVAGTPITTYCERARLSVPQRLQLFLQVLNAVQYAHANLVIHRDLKPSNILVTDDGQVQLLDFGIAKLLTQGEAKETELTQLGGRAFTPDYAAPEQIAGAPITTAADVYALGVMLYELLTGQPPYRLTRDSRGALEEAILQVDPLPLSHAALTESAADARATTRKKLARALRGDLDTITIKALKKLPAERYATANAFSEDVARYLRGEVVLAQRDSFAYRARKFVRRHRVAIAAGSILTLTLAGGLAGTTYEARVASVERDAAREAHMRSLTQTAAARLKDADVPAAFGIILEVLRHPGVQTPYTSEALNVFQEARSADVQVLAVTGHTDRVRSAAFSSDGSRLVTASYDRTARIWDAASGQQIALLNGHTDRVTFAVFSRDGRRVATASYDKTARIWDAATAQQILVLTGHTDRVRSVAFSPDGRRVVTASYDNTARIWDVTTGQQIRLLSGHSETVQHAEFSPDSRWVVTASYDKTARIWDVESGRQLMVLSGHTDRLNSAAFSPDGRRVITASFDNTARIWDAATGQQSLLLSGHPEMVLSAVFSPDGERVVTASEDKTARIWDSGTGQQLMVLSGHTDRVTSAALSPDGRVVTSSDDKTARIWDASAGRQMRLFSGHTDRVWSAAFSPDDRRVVTASDDKTARVWDSETGRQIVVLSGHTDALETAAFSPDGRRVITGSDDKTARIWDAESGRQITLLGGHTDQVSAATFSPDGRHVVTGSDDKTARIWDAESGHQLVQLNGHTEWVTSAAFSPDGKSVVTSSSDKTARTWDAKTGRQILLLSGHTERVMSARFSPDGRQIVTASFDKTARTWDAATGQQILVLSGHRGRVLSAAFSPDGRRIVTASEDKIVRVWDAETGRQMLLLSGHTNRVWSAGFSRDGQRVVTASEDKTARIWDARSLGIETQMQWAQAAQFDPLPSTERFQLGLPDSDSSSRWPVDRTKCDEAAAAPYDPDRRAQGVMADGIVADIAAGACAESKQTSDGRARSIYQQGRALLASGNVAVAGREFQEALTLGYRAAGIDLGVLLSQPARGMLDVPRAISLFERAWKDQVTIAGFELGRLYEHGVRRADNESEYVLAPDSARAWLWYQKAADMGEPDALARFAQRNSDAAFSEQAAAKKSSYLLESFKFYTAAAERARSEDWPDDAWRNWRYRRASLARLLAREGMMQDVADVYINVIERSAPRAPTLRKRMVSLAGRN